MLILQRERKYNFICSLFRLRRYRQRVEVRGGGMWDRLGQLPGGGRRGRQLSVKLSGEGRGDRGPPQHDDLLIISQHFLPIKI